MTAAPTGIRRRPRRATVPPGVPDAGPPAPAWPHGRLLRALRAAARRLLLFPLLRTCTGRMRITGSEHLPHGPFVLVANHASHADTAAILRALPAGLRGRLAPAAAADYFFAGRVRATLSAALLGAFPFPRSGRAGLHRAAAELRSGRVVLLFPQGSRSGGRFLAGVGLLAAGGATVVPAGVTGTGTVLPKGTRRPRRARVTVSFGHPRRYAPDADPAAVAADLEAAVHSLAAGADPAADAHHPRRSFHAAARDLATSRRGPALLFSWAAAEALLFPVIPDLAIGLLAAAAPRRFVPLAVAGAAGSVVGGLVAYGLGAAGLVPPLLPLVTAGMAETAHALLAESGAAGVWAQPLSAVPYKAFAFAAPAHGVALLPFLAVTAVGRGARMLAVAAVLAALGAALRRWCPPRRLPAVYATATGLVLVLFTLGLAEIVVRS